MSYFFLILFSPLHLCTSSIRLNVLFTKHKNQLCNLPILVSKKKYVTVFRKTNWLVRKTKLLLFFYLLRRANTPYPNLKPIRHFVFGVRHASFSLFPLVSSCSNDYFRMYMYMVIDFLANRLVFQMQSHIFTV